MDRLPQDREGPLGHQGRQQVRPDRRQAARRRQDDRRASPTACSCRRCNLANGAKELLDEVATGKITGEEDRFSHTDLWDFAANLEGSRRADRRAPPGARGAGRRAWPRRSTTSSPRSQAELDKHRNGDGWKFHNELSEADLKALADAINALAEPISKVAPLVGRPSSSHADGGRRPRPAGDRLPDRERDETMDRRKMLGLAGAGAVGAAAAGVAGATLIDGATHPAQAADAGAAIPFYGEHQAGIVTPAQDRLHFVAFDVITDKKAELVELLEKWTMAAARMTAGRDAGSIGAVDGAQEAAPDDTGEAIGLPPSGLTLTIGFGADAVPHRARARTASASRTGARPPWRTCRASPRTRSSRRSPAATSASRRARTTRRWPCTRCATWPASASAWSACAGRSWASGVPRRPPAAQVTAAEPVRLQGRHRATSRPRTPQLLKEQLWVQPGDGADWMAGGSYVVTRKIRMLIETWDRTSLGEQEAIIGRDKGEGAPLGGAAEFDRPNFAAKGADGEPVIAGGRARATAHPDAERRRPAAAPRLQLRRRLRRARPPRRGTVLHRVPA